MAGLVLVDTGPGFRSDPGREAWNEMAETYALRPRDQGARRDAPQRRAQPDVHRDAAGLILAARWRADPVRRPRDGGAGVDHGADVGLVGELDTPFLAGSRYMAGKIPDARLVVIDGAGHAPPITHPDSFNAALRTFLERVGEPG